MWVIGESFHWVHWDRFGGQIGGRKVSSLEDHLLGENCSFLKEEFQYSNMLEMTYSFLDRLINLGLPRTRDFQGLSPNSFDGHGNYSIGMREQGVFPELRYDALGKPRGMDVCITTTAKTDEEGHKLLALMGMPFREGGGQQTIVRKKKLKKHHFDTKSKGRR